MLPLGPDDDLSPFSTTHFLSLLSPLLPKCTRRDLPSSLQLGPPWEQAAPSRRPTRRPAGQAKHMASRSIAGNFDASSAQHDVPKHHGQMSLSLAMHVRSDPVV